MGCPTVVPRLAARLVARRPLRVLDLGIGMGFLGSVCRQWNDEAMMPWISHLVGVEAHEPYRNPLWAIYDEVRIEDVRLLSWSDARWDFIILSDVLEHFDVGDGLRVIDAMKSALAPRGEAFIATPSWFFVQDAVHGNDHEIHRSVWTPAQLVREGFTILHDGSVDVYGGAMLQAVYVDPRDP